MKRLSDITITEAYEALQKVMRFEEQLEEENSNIEKLQLLYLGEDYTIMEKCMKMQKNRYRLTDILLKIPASDWSINIMKYFDIILNTSIREHLYDRTQFDCPDHVLLWRVDCN